MSRVDKVEKKPTASVALATKGLKLSDEIFDTVADFLLEMALEDEDASHKLERDRSAA